MRRGELQCQAFVHNYTESIELLFIRIAVNTCKTVKTHPKYEHKNIKYSHDSTNLPALGILPVQIETIKVVLLEKLDGVLNELPPG